MARSRTRARAVAYRRLAYKATYAGNYRQADIYNARADQLLRDADRQDAFTERLKKQQERRGH